MIPLKTTVSLKVAMVTFSSSLSNDFDMLELYYIRGGLD